MKSPAMAGTMDASLVGLDSRAMGDLRRSAATWMPPSTTPTARTAIATTP